MTTAFAKSGGDEAPIQVFDWRTGKGKWQLDSGDDYKLSIVSR